jgi:hypothetical protein
MSRDNSLVQRLITFLKKPSALEHDQRGSVHNPYDDYEPQEARLPAADGAPAAVSHADARADTPLENGRNHTPGQGSRLDALVVRALQQFHAPLGFVIRYDDEGRMRYCTGRSFQGRYIEHTEVNPDRRAIFLALDSGESQLFVHMNGDSPAAVLCGPLWVNNEVIGVLYLDNPARSRLHRGVFDVFCEQAARLIGEGADLA